MYIYIYYITVNTDLLFQTEIKIAENCCSKEFGEFMFQYTNITSKKPVPGRPGGRINASSFAALIT